VGKKPYGKSQFNADFTGVQAVSDTIRPLPALTRHVHPYYSVIEEIVEGFVEGFETKQRRLLGAGCKNQLLKTLNLIYEPAVL
jgi:hypothetical protein